MVLKAGWRSISIAWTSHNSQKPPAPAVHSDGIRHGACGNVLGFVAAGHHLSDYQTNPTAKDAAEELTNLPKYNGPKDNGQVTPELLFRGGLPDGKTLR